MSNENKNLQATGIKIEDDTTPELEKTRKENLAHLIVFSNEKIKDIENRLLDNPHINGLPNMFQDALRWSNISQWLNNIMAQRYIMPEQAKKHAEKSKELTEEERRKANGLSVIP